MHAFAASAAFVLGRKTKPYVVLHVLLLKLGPNPSVIHFQRTPLLETGPDVE